MTQVNMHEAKSNLSKLVEKAVNGESFIIAKAGKPMVWVTAYTEGYEPHSNIKKGAGFMKDNILIPDNFPESFNRMIEDEIVELFEGKL